MKLAFLVIVAFVFFFNNASATEIDNNSIAAEVLRTMDASFDPCNDFYNYSCGGWLSTHQIPADRAKIDRSFTAIEEYNEKILFTIVKDPSTGKLNTFYESCMDLNSIQQQGIDPIVNLLDFVEQIPSGDVDSLMSAVGILHTFGIDLFFGFDVQIDSGDPTKNIIALGQSGLALPDRSYYLDADFEELRGKYVTHIKNMFILAGYGSSLAAKYAQYVLSFETTIAKFTTPNDDLVDPFATYNNMSYSEFMDLSGDLPWDTYFESAQVFSQITHLTVDVPAYFANLSLVVPNMHEFWNPYILFHILHTSAPTLTREFVTEDFNFFGKVLRGLQQPSARNRTCVQYTDGAMGELLGKYYVQKAFGGDSKQNVQTMVDNIEDAMHSNLLGLDWMDNTTRTRALEKLSLVYNMIGYPAVPRNYTFEVSEDSFATNVMFSRYEQFQRKVNQIDQPADRYSWEMSPPTVNAYYSPNKNEMVFPAGILQTPYFNLTYPGAMNYGGIGMVIGHELTHGFDNQGRDFDGTGLLKDWWLPSTSKNFDTRVQCVIDQYSKFEVLPGVFVNGKLTQGENIADMGGIKLSYNAYKKLAGSSFNAPSIVPNLTNAQLFFVAFAQGWCSKATPNALILRVKTDPHSPAMFRVMGPLMNLPQFSQTFNCPVGSRMNPTNRCQVW